MEACIVMFQQAEDDGASTGGGRSRSWSTSERRFPVPKRPSMASSTFLQDAEPHKGHDGVSGEQKDNTGSDSSIPAPPLGRFRCKVEPPPYAS